MHEMALGMTKTRNAAQIADFLTSHKWLRLRQIQISSCKLEQVPGYEGPKRLTGPIFCPFFSK